MVSRKQNSFSLLVFKIARNGELVSLYRVMVIRNVLLFICYLLMQGISALDISDTVTLANYSEQIFRTFD